MFTAMQNLEQAAEPTITDWEHVNDAVMLMEALRDMQVVQDPDNLLDDAIEALGKAGARAMEGKGIRLDGLAIRALRAVLEDYTEVLAQIPARTMIAAHRKAEAKVAKIVRKK